jgi:hypothetical protein
MTSLEAFLKHTRLDWTGLTQYEWLIGEAPFTPDIIYTYAVNLGQTLLEAKVIISVCDINTTNSAVHTARCCQCLLIFHSLFSFY